MANDVESQVQAQFSQLRMPNLLAQLKNIIRDVVRAEIAKAPKSAPPGAAYATPPDIEAEAEKAAKRREAQEKIAKAQAELAALGDEL